MMQRQQKSAAHNIAIARNLPENCGLGKKCAYF